MEKDELNIFLLYRFTLNKAFLRLLLNGRKYPLHLATAGGPIRNDRNRTALLVHPNTTPLLMPKPHNDHGDVVGGKLGECVVEQFLRHCLGILHVPHELDRFLVLAYVP